MRNSHEKLINLKSNTNIAKNNQNKNLEYDIEEYFSLISLLMDKYKKEKQKSTQYAKEHSKDPTIFQTKTEVLTEDSKINWKTFILKYLASEYKKGRLWTKNLHTAILLQLSYFEKTWKNFLIWQEFEIRTKPPCLIPNMRRKFYPQSEYFTYEVKTPLNNTSPSKDVQDYQEKVYNYIRILNEHILNIEHPINFIIKKFVQYFTPYIKENVDKLVELKNRNKKKFDVELKKVFEPIISQIKTFIKKTEECLILYYSQPLIHTFLNKDTEEISNLITGQIFNEGNLYKYVIHLISLNQLTKTEEFKSVLNFKANIQPEDLSISNKFCLNSSSISFLKQFNKASSPNLTLFYQNKPYANTISLLESINLYKKPYDKFLLINKLNRSINESVNKFWISVDKNAPLNLLKIEGEDLMNIFSYIVIKSQMESLVTQMKFIKLFTSIQGHNNIINKFYTAIEDSMLFISNSQIDKSGTTSLNRDWEDLFNFS